MSTRDPFKNVRIVLCETSHPGNIGAAARAMKTMGFSNLCLVNPLRFPAPEAQWRAARAVDVLESARVCDSLDEALTGVAYAVACTARPREVAVPAADARQAAERMTRIAQAQSVAIVFGNETSGLTTAAVNKCQLAATIPANSDYSSLNLAAAVQVMCYEVRLAALAPASGEQAAELAPHEQVEGFLSELERTMVDIGFMDPQYPKKLMPRLRRLFARTQLEKEEINILRGLLKALRNPAKPR